MNNKDKLFYGKKAKLSAFVFDEQVAKVFPDMIRRSVPGYELLVSLLGMLVQRYLVKQTRVYDLGCSFGEVTLSIIEQSNYSEIEYICVDNSPQMIEQCRHNMVKIRGDKQVTLQCENVLDTTISNASVVVLNLTLQFISPDRRQALLDSIYDGLCLGGILILSEKIKIDEQTQRQLISQHHYDFKKANGYTDLEIRRKRDAIEGVLIAESQQQHIERLQLSGFINPTRWFECLGFVSWLAIK